MRVCICVCICVCELQQSCKWKKLSGEEAAIWWQLSVYTVSVFSHGGLSCMLVEEEEEEETYLETDKTGAGLSNYTEIILIARESRGALNFISSFSLRLHQFLCFSLSRPIWLASSSLLTHFTSSSVKSPPKISFYTHMQLSAFIWGHWVSEV